MRLAATALTGVTRDDGRRKSAHEGSSPVPDSRRRDDVGLFFFVSAQMGLPGDPWGRSHGDGWRVHRPLGAGVDIGAVCVRVDSCEDRNHTY